MGLFVSKLFSSFTSRGEEVRLVMLGLDAAGKTTALYKLKLGDVVTTIPTIGFNVETVEYKSLSMTVWDVGGQKKLRGLWHHYYRDCKALLFIVDSADRARLEEVKEELWATMSSEELKEVPVLVYANKQDLPRAVSPGDLAAMLDLPKLPRSRPWHVQACQAVTGDGLYEGLDWLDKTLKARR